MAMIEWQSLYFGIFYSCQYKFIHFFWQRLQKAWPSLTVQVFPLWCDLQKIHRKISNVYDSKLSVIKKCLALCSRPHLLSLILGWIIYVHQKKKRSRRFLTIFYKLLVIWRPSSLVMLILTRIVKYLNVKSINCYLSGFWKLLKVNSQNNAVRNSFLCVYYFGLPFLGQKWISGVFSSPTLSWLIDGFDLPPFSNTTNINWYRVSLIHSTISDIQTRYGRKESYVQSGTFACLRLTLFNLNGIDVKLYKSTALLKP